MAYTTRRESSRAPTIFSDQWRAIFERQMRRYWWLKRQKGRHDIGDVTGTDTQRHRDRCLCYLRCFTLFCVVFCRFYVVCWIINVVIISSPLTHDIATVSSHTNSECPSPRTTPTTTRSRRPTETVSSESRPTSTDREYEKRQAIFVAFKHLC